MQDYSLIFYQRYASDHSIDAYKAYCQKKLLQCETVESQLARTYPPSHLEWKATTRCANLALETSFSDRKYLKLSSNFLLTFFFFPS
jgi:hypothetical protein